MLSPSLQTRYALALLLLSVGATLHAQDSLLLNGMEWRHVGPNRGGRVTTVTGVPSQPNTFYMGVASGGVWKTTDAGASWRPISDDHFRSEERRVGQEWALRR